MTVFSAKLKAKIECAVELISDKSKWTKYFYAVLEDNSPTVVSDPHAVKFCAIGALRKCGVFRSEEIGIAAEYSLRFHSGIVDDNDAQNGRRRVIEHLKALIA